MNPKRHEVSLVGPRSLAILRGLAPVWYVAKGANTRQEKGGERELMTIRPLTAEFMAGRIYALGSALAASRPAIRPKIMHSALDEAP